MSLPLYLVCNICAHQQPYEPLKPAICQECNSQWLEAHYDYQSFKRELLRGLPERPSNMWRYQDVLPLKTLPPSIYTPLAGRRCGFPSALLSGSVITRSISKTSAMDLPVHSKIARRQWRWQP